MKNEKGKQAEESGFLNGVGWGEVIRVIMFMLYFEQLWHGRPQEGAMGSPDPPLDFDIKFFPYHYLCT